MFSHVTMGARDFARMGAFRNAAPAPFGLSRRWELRDASGLAKTGRRTAGARTPILLVQKVSDRGGAGDGSMSAYPSPQTMRAAHAADLPAGGADEGAPAERPRHGRPCHCAHLRHPYGNKLHRGDLAATAAAAG